MKYTRRKVHEKLENGAEGVGGAGHCLIWCPRNPIGAGPMGA